MVPFIQSRVINTKYSCIDGGMNIPEDVAKVALAKPAIADTADTADTPGRIRGTAQLSKRAQGFGEYPLSSSVMRTYEYTVATK
jgi:hypothetical protein